MLYKERDGLLYMDGLIMDSSLNLLKGVEVLMKSPKGFSLNSLGGSNPGAYSLGTYLHNSGYIEKPILAQDNVCSAAIFLFVYFKKRFSQPNSRFGFHELSFPEGTEDFRIKRTTNNYSGWIAQRTKFSQSDVLCLMKNEEQLKPKEALKYGLIYEIKKFL